MSVHSHSFFYSNGAESIAIERLERFRRLLAIYQRVWHFAPRKDRFVELWNDSEDVTKAEASAQRLANP